MPSLVTPPKPLLNVSKSEIYYINKIFVAANQKSYIFTSSPIFPSKGKLLVINNKGVRTEPSRLLCYVPFWVCIINRGDSNPAIFISSSIFLLLHANIQLCFTCYFHISYLWGRRNNCLLYSSIPLSSLLHTNIQLCFPNYLGYRLNSRVDPLYSSIFVVVKDY